MLCCLVVSFGTYSAVMYGLTSVNLVLITTAIGQTALFLVSRKIVLAMVSVELFILGLLIGFSLAASAPLEGQWIAVVPTCIRTILGGSLFLIFLLGSGFCLSTEK